MMSLPWIKEFVTAITPIIAIIGKMLAAGRERPSPSNILPVRALLQSHTNINIDLSQLLIPFKKNPRVWIPLIPNTGSMDPVFDAGNNNFLIAGDGPEEMEILRLWLETQEPGNVVVYRRRSDRQLIIHRIIKKQLDAEGIAYTLRGDNNARNDRQVVRGEDIEWISIGTIY